MKRELTGIMSFEDRKRYLEKNRGSFTPERLLELTERLNSDRAAAALRNAGRFNARDSLVT